MKLPTNDENFVKSPKVYAPVGRLYHEILGKIFSFGAPCPHSAPIEVKFGIEESESTFSSTPNFNPIGATCGAKNMKIAWVTELLALCAVRNAAGKEGILSDSIPSMCTEPFW